MMRVFALCCAGLAAVVSAAPAGQGHAVIGVAAERYGDLYWENDRTAYRIYSRQLEAAEPPSSSGIDVWAKRRPEPFVAAALKGGRYHEISDAGADFFHVGTSRGLGGLGIWEDNKLWTSRNYERLRVLKRGPERVQFEVDYAPWPVGVGRKVWETRRFELADGSRFTRLTSTIRSDRKDPITVAIGISRASVGPADAGDLVVDRDAGRITYWTPQDPKHGAMGLALLVDPTMIVGATRDSENNLVLLRVKPGRPFVYYIGSAWQGAGEIGSAAAWHAEVAAAKVTF